MQKWQTATARRDKLRAGDAGADPGTARLLVIAEEHVAVIDLAVDVDGADAAFAMLNEKITAVFETMRDLSIGKTPATIIDRYRGYATANAKCLASE